MAVQTLNQIYRSLGNVYDPQAKLIRQQQADIPNQIAAEEKGLEARQTQAFGDILGGARQRGLGFAGIPLAEQAKYTSTEFLPALARLRQTGRQQATTLEEALLGINERRRTFAQQIREGDLQRNLALKQLREQQRQFNKNYKLQQQQMADARRASAGGGSGGGGFAPTLTDLLGGGGKSKPLTVKDQAYASVQKFLQGDDKSIASDWNATFKSAQYGNKMDRLKLQLYAQARPDLFKDPFKTSGLFRKAAR